MAGDRGPKLRLVAGRQNYAKEELHPPAVEHHTRQLFENRSRTLGRQLRFSFFVGAIMGSFKQGGEEIRLARKVICEMRLPQASGFRDLGLGQRHDPLRFDDVQRGVQNALSNIIVGCQNQDFLARTVRAAVSIPKMPLANHEATSVAWLRSAIDRPGLANAVLVIYQYGGGRRGANRIIAPAQEAKMKNGATLILLIGVAAAWATVGVAGSGDDADNRAVRQLLMTMFDKPEAPLGVEAVVVEYDAAIADWSQGEVGGRALLRRMDGAWSIALCAGDALKSSVSLEKLGIAKPVADALAAKLSEAEGSLSPAFLEKFSRFDGVVAVDSAGGHSPVDPHHRAVP